MKHCQANNTEKF